MRFTDRTQPVARTRRRKTGGTTSTEEKAVQRFMAQLDLTDAEMRSGELAKDSARVPMRFVLVADSVPHSECS